MPYREHMRPVITQKDGTYTLSLEARDIEGIAATRALEPDGYFWEGVVRELVAARQPTLAGQFRYDSDQERFAARSRHRDVVMTLQGLLVQVLDHPDELRHLVGRAVDAEFMD